MANMHELLKAMIEQGASDLHITTGTPPQLRIDGKLRPLKLPALTPQETKQLCYSILTDSQKHQFEEQNELDLSFGVQKLSRFRGNVFVQRGNVAGAFRAIPFKIMGFDELGLPPIVEELSKKPRGLVLVTGPTGSGKSTTLATIIDKINQERNEHIVTIEDPIEYLHGHKSCVVNQREIGADTKSFKAALKYILRQDPDVCLIGELRDLETIEAALTVAETGHLAFATLHTNSAVQSINRIVDVFPPYQIREDKIHQIYSSMQIGQGKFGMQTMNQSLAGHIASRAVSLETAMGQSPDVEELKKLVASMAPAAHPGRKVGAG